MVLNNMWSKIRIILTLVMSLNILRNSSMGFEICPTTWFPISKMDKYNFHNFKMLTIFLVNDHSADKTEKTYKIMLMV